MAITPISFISPEGKKNSQEEVAIILCTLAIIFIAWGRLFYQHLQMSTQTMAEMWMPPSEMLSWRWLDFSLLFIMWAVMMVAMMLPSALPMINAYHHVCHKRGQHPFLNSCIFSAAYLFIWFFFSVFLTLLQWCFHGLNWLSPMMDNQNALFASTIFFIAGAYQFTSLKQDCLKHCQSPIGFLLNRWQEGYRGAWVMGLKHGITCVGCCWAQMLLMFALGVMNLLAMALLTAFICLEKFLPINNKLLSNIGGVCFIAWAVLIQF